MTENLGVRQPTYICKKHGEVESVITSTIEGYEGVWCQKCHIEWWNEQGWGVKKKEGT